MTDVRSDERDNPSGVSLSHVMLHWHGSMNLHETVEFHAATGVHGIPDRDAGVARVWHRKR